MNIFKTSLGIGGAKPASQASKAQEAQQQQQDDSNAPPEESYVPGAYSGDRNIAYTVLAGLSQGSAALSQSGVSLGGSHQIATSALGVLSAGAALKNGIHSVRNGEVSGREAFINNGAQFFSGALTAVTPYAGNWAPYLLGANLTLLGLNATLNQPGNLAMTTAREIGTMGKEVLGFYPKNDAPPAEQ